ncbi:DUF4232 domain-containing protein [Psychromicrobium xiongbiense]|uniref:DUF4232 domain-containing protein n=1 Tax=Psychromicrobium xiongbiense TaxID=3051184 RepID=UPI0025546BCC|nr:DUF4232 domain-containing protein [Psychromicrobium sp. YIM S02556]
MAFRRATDRPSALPLVSVVAALGGVALLMTSCGASPAPAQSSGQTTSASASSTPGTSSSAAASPSTSAAAGPSGPAVGLPCTAAALKGTLHDGSGAAGSVYYTLTLTNTSSTMCVLDGYPGVSLVGKGNGTQLGAPADRDASRPSAGPITMVPGASANAVLRYTQAGNYQNCTQTPADGLRVYPPSATDSLYIAQPLTACTESSMVLLEIGAFAAS